ncbi:hypothetical protein GCM10027073_13390 [Streptomyces chlorus]
MDRPRPGRPLPGTEQDTWGELITGQDFRRDGDLELISQPLDFLGINYYRPITVADAPYRESDPARRAATDNRYEEAPTPGVRHTAMGRPVVPHILTDLLVDLKEQYGAALPPLHITENGSAEDDRVTGGAVHDPDRVAYLCDHLTALRATMDRGVDVRGYYVWSLLDNFEWAYGYGKRFGIVRVDYDSRRRIPKDSYHWYRRMIAAQHP